MPRVLLKLLSPSVSHFQRFKSSTDSHVELFEKLFLRQPPLQIYLVVKIFPCLSYLKKQFQQNALTHTCLLLEQEEACTHHVPLAANFCRLEEISRDAPCNRATGRETEDTTRKGTQKEKKNSRCQKKIHPRPVERLKKKTGLREIPARCSTDTIKELNSFYILATSHFTDSL